MADNSKKLSELPTASNAASTDRVLILRDPAGSPSTRTIAVGDLTSSIRYANSTVAGTVKVGNNLSINATGYLNAQAGSGSGNTGNYSFNDDIMLLQSGGNMFINNPNNAIQIGGSWLVQMSASDEANNVWGGGNTQAYAWVYKETDNYAESYSYIQANNKNVSGGFTTNEDRAFEVVTSKPGTTTRLKYDFDGILHLDDIVGDIQKDGVSVIAPVFPIPNIQYTGIFNNMPYYWKYTGSPTKLQWTSNGAFNDSASNYYWLDQNFDDGYYDLSGLTSIRFTNIGGVKGYFDFSAKSEVVMHTLDMGEIAIVEDWFNFAGFSNTLTTFSANNLAEVGGGFTIYGNSFDNGPAMEFPALKRIGNDMYIDWNWNNFANTPAPSFPALEHVEGAIYIYYNKFTSWSNFPNVHRVQWNVEFHDNTNNEASSYACPGFPVLENINGYLNIYSNQYMTSIPDFTALRHIGSNINIYNNSELTAFPAFPVLTYCANIYCQNNPLMTTVGASFLPTIDWVDGEVNFQDCSLDQASIDAILVKLASLDGTGTTTPYQYRNIYLGNGNNAAPSQTGLDAIAVLQSRNCNVYVNV